MPTFNQAVELYQECTWKWIDNYNSTGVSGMECKGPNGNTIFFPAGGLKMNSSLDYTSNGNYWTGELNEAWLTANYASFIDFNRNGLIKSNLTLTSADYRYWGRNIRPVILKKYNPN